MPEAEARGSALEFEVPLGSVASPCLRRKGGRISLAPTLHNYISSLAPSDLTSCGPIVHQWGSLHCSQCGLKDSELLLVFQCWTLFYHADGILNICQFSKILTEGNL